MPWGLRSLIEGIRDELRGWDNFRRVTGLWPVYSMLWSTISIPIVFASEIYILIRALNTGNQPLIYATVFVGTISLATFWYVLRRLARKTDIARAKRESRTETSSEDIEDLIR